MQFEICLCSNRNPSWPKSEEMTSKAAPGMPSAIRALSFTGNRMSLSMPMQRVLAVIPAAAADVVGVDAQREVIIGIGVKTGAEFLPLILLI